MQQPIIRTYRGASRADAEHAYSIDAAQAQAAGYEPVSHRWTQDWNGHTLSVAYQPRPAMPAAAPPAEYSGEQTATAAHGLAPNERLDPQERPADPGPHGMGAAPSGVDAAAEAAPTAAEAPPTAEAAPAAEAAPYAATERSSESPAQPLAVGRRARLTIQVLDMHCAGEPLRIVRSGFPDVPHAPVLERRRWVEENADHVRRAIIHEPRGHRDMYGAVLLPPHAHGTDVCLLFMHNDGYSTMCGHGVIAVTTALIEDGLMAAQEPETTIRFEVPAGIVTATAATQRQADGSHLVSRVRFANVPSYLAAEAVPVSPDGVTLHGRAAAAGELRVDLSFGGAYYGIVDAADLGLRVVPEQADELRRAGAAITDLLRRDRTPIHPTLPELNFVYGTIIVDHHPQTSPDGRAPDADLRNATIFAEAELDRSPCGSGTSAILAQMFGRGRLQVGDEITNAGITGESFLGRIEGQTQLGPQPAVATSVAGTAYLTGYATLLVDERDPLGEGFFLG